MTREEFGLYAIYDELTEQYGAPMIFINDKIAIKGWKKFCDEKKSEEIEGQYLVRIGTYNPYTAEIISEKTLMRLE